MRFFTLMTTAIVGTAFYSPVYANEDLTPNTSPNSTLSQLKQVKVNNLKVDAKANQPENIKDPLQPLNRQIYAFNDTIDRHVIRPVAVQYVEKVPAPVRGSYRSFKNNLGEPWNAINQVVQGRPIRALQTLGRFSINTLTSLGFADTARHFGLSEEDESFGTTLGYYGVPSGPYLVLPLFGPNTFRSTLGLAVDSQGRVQKYTFENSLYWTDQALNGLDTRAQLLDFEGVLAGDRYAQIRDIYLQRTDFLIAEKKGIESEDLFISDEFEDESFYSDETTDDEATLSE